MNQYHRAFPVPAQRFGRRRRFTVAAPAPMVSALTDDLKLFAMTFIGGLLFMTVYLA